MSQIAEQFGVSIWSVVYVLRKLGLPRRSPAESNRIVFEMKPLSFSIRPKRDRMLEAVGAMLYWAEGYKTPKAGGIDFANSDLAMVQLFMKFLRSRYQLDEKRLRAFVYCYNNQNKNSLIQFWSKKLAIPKSQFTRSYVRKDFRADGRKMEHGLVHVRYSDKKLLLDILNLIELFKVEVLRRSYSGNYTTL